jgi:SpoIID/LytB domain protein
VRTRVLLLATAVALVVLPPAADATVPVLVIEGKGFGHGVGMAQDGDYWMGLNGATTEQILGHFYPGTALSRRAGYVRVPVLVAPGGDATLVFPQGGDVRDAASGAQSTGFPVPVAAGGRVRIRFDGRYHVRVDRGEAAPPTTVAIESSTTSSPASTSTSTSSTSSSTSTTAFPELNSTTSVPLPDETTTTSTTAIRSERQATTTSTSTTMPPASPAVREVTTARPLLAVPVRGGTTLVEARGRRYRGVIEATASGGPLRLVNQLDVEEYLRGMGEVRDPRWPLASLRAQAVVARTYALRAMEAVGELCEDQRCQVYLGQQAEYAAMDRAVASTQGQVVVFRGRLASTVYSANGGGVSASTEEGFGTSGDGYPYLRAAPYATEDPLPWTVRVIYGDVGARLGYGGDITAVEVTRRGPSGRAVEVTLTGSVGAVTVEGRRFDAALGLRSTFFNLRVEQSEAPPPPPPLADPAAGDAVVEQALPEEVPAVGSRPARAVAARRRAETPAEPAGNSGEIGAVAFLAGLLVLLVGAGLTMHRRR